MSSKIMTTEYQCQKYRWLYDLYTGLSDKHKNSWFMLHLIPSFECNFIFAKFFTSHDYSSYYFYK